MSYWRNPQTVQERMPETIVKIIGSKYVRFPAEKFKKCPDRQKDAERKVQKILGGIQDTESFRQSLLRTDRSSCGLLPLFEFQAVCASHGAPLTISSLTPLLEDNAFSNQGNIRWKQIADLLQETEKEKKSLEQKVTEKQEAAISKEEEGSGYAGPSEKKTAENVAIGRDPALQDARPLTEPALHLFEPRSPGDEEAWIDRFRKLENVLELCQIKDTGLVEAERAKQIINKYNLIYRLCLSPEKISDALDKFHSGAHIVLEPVLHFLKEL